MLRIVTRLRNAENLRNLTIRQPQLASIQSMFERQQTERLSSEMIIHALAESEDSPWPDRLPLTKVQLARPKPPIGLIEQESFGIWSSLQHGQLMTESNDFGLKPG